MVVGLNTKEVYRYQRRQPEKTLLFRAIETYWSLFIKEQARVGKKLPLFIHQEFDEYLKCGIPNSDLSEPTVINTSIHFAITLLFVFVVGKLARMEMVYRV